MKTLVVTLADLEDIPHGTASSRTSVDVTAHYTGPVTLEDGTIIPPAIKAGHMSAMGVWEFEVHASDSPLVKDEYQGFAVVVNVVVRQTGPGHIKPANVTRTVKVLEAASSPVSLGTLPPAEGFPARWVSVDEMVADMDAAVAAAETAESNAAAALANVGPAAVAAAAPAVAAAQSAQADAAQSAEDVELALQAQFLTQDEGVAALLGTAAGPQTFGAFQSLTKPTMFGPGIDRTGASDSTAALQAFIDANPRKTIYLPEGVYKFTNLTLGDGQIIEGAGRSTYRDRYSTLGTAGWMNNANFGGTVLRSTATAGVAVTVVDPAEVTEGGLSNLTLIGPGAGTSVGLQFGSISPLKSLVNPHLRNVAVGNFATGVLMYYVNEGDFASLILRGCTTGLDLASNVNDNTFTKLDVQWCVDGVKVSSDSYVNTFLNPLGQSNTGTAFTISGPKNALYNAYFEGNEVAAVHLTSTAIANKIDSPALLRPTDKIIVAAGAPDNALTNIGWNGGAATVENAGTRTLIQGRIPNLTDTGSGTLVIDSLQPGTPFGAWKAYTPTMGGAGWSLGNASVNAAYVKVGRTIHFRVFISFGSTTTYGTSSPTLTLPLGALYRAAMTSVMVKNGVGSYTMGPRVSTDGGVVAINTLGTKGLSEQTTTTNPAAWAAGDTLELYGTYQAGAA